MAAQVPFLVSAARNLRQDSVAYALGRFPFIRRAYGTSRHLVQRIRGTGTDGPGGRSLFEGVNVEAAAASLRETSLFAPLQLPADLVGEVLRFALEGTCRRQQRPPTFRASDVKHGILPNGELAILADVLDSARNEAIDTIAREPTVLEVVSRYLGYVPKEKRIRLIWSFVCDASEERRLNEGQTVVYHFDVQSYNFAYANYYLTDVDARSGAHTMIVGSHDDKPLSWLLGSAKKTDQEIRGHYASDREITLLGKAGFGFVQDASCYHRALAPIDRDRLMLQIRYY